MRTTIIILVIAVIAIISSRDFIFPEKEIVYKEYCSGGFISFRSEGTFNNAGCRQMPCEVSYEDGVTRYDCSDEVKKPISITCFYVGAEQHCEYLYNKATTTPNN